MGRVKVPRTKAVRWKRYRLVTKPTTAAFCRGKRIEQKTVPEEWLSAALLVAENDPDVERYFYEEILL